MSFRPNIHYESLLSSDELKQIVFKTYESGDILKHQEFNTKFAKLNPEMIESLRESQFINDTRLKYLGKHYQGNFELWSPKFIYWNSVFMYIRHTKSGSRLNIKFVHFWLIFIPLFLLNIGALFSLTHNSGSPLLLISIPLTLLFVLKLRMTQIYFHRRIFNK